MTRTDISQVIRTKPRPLDLDPSIYLRNDYVVVDFETTNLDHGSPANPHNNLVLACWVSGETGVSGGVGREQRISSVFGNEYEQSRLLEAIKRASFVVAYHAKFECGWLKRCGIELRDLIVYDPMLAEYVLYGNLKPIGGYSLDSTLSRYKIAGKMRYVSALIDAGICPSTIPREDLEKYGKCDVRRTHDLFLQQRKRVFRERRERVLYGRCLQSPMLADIESQGVHLDTERVLSHSRTKVREYGRVNGALEEFTGAVNWNSPKQVGVLLYEKLGFDEATDYLGNVIKTGTGNRSASDPTISLLNGRTEEQRKFKRLWNELAPLKKEVSILATMREVCDEDSGHFFASFNQAVTANHRLSSTGGKWGLQLQNQPRSFKKLFRARDKGRKIIEGDCPQLEFRAGIDLSGDETGLGDILARADVHSLTSAVTGFNRQDSKPHTFKPMYGGRSGPPRLRRYYDAFRRRYHRMYDVQTGWTYEVLEHKKLRTATGLWFYWPDTEVRSGGFISNTPQIFNLPISMFATADISQLSLLLTWHGIRGLDTSIVNTIHDSGILDSPDEEVDRVQEIMVQSYTQEIYDVLLRLYNYTFSTPLGLGLKCGEFWGEGEERKYEPEDRFEFTSDTTTAIRLDS